MPRRQPSEPTFFLDENLAMDSLADALRPHVLLETFHAHFARGVEDAVWLPEAAARGWFVLTRDGRLRWRPHEVAAVKAAGAAVFVLRGKDLTGAAIVESVVAAVPALKKVASTRRRPFVCAFHRDGRLDFKLGGERRGGPR
jgi:hypothetical protein